MYGWTRSSKIHSRQNLCRRVKTWPIFGSTRMADDRYQCWRVSTKVYSRSGQTGNNRVSMSACSSIHDISKIWMNWQETTISNNINFMIKIVKIWAAFPLNNRDSKFFNVTWYKQNMNELTKKQQFLTIWNSWLKF